MIFIFSFQFHAAFGEQHLEDINWITEIHPPQNYLDNGRATGISVDVLLGIWSKLGFEKNKDHIKIIPWARSYIMLKKDKNTCLFAMSMTRERKEIFKFVGPYMKDIVGIIAKKSKTIKVESFKGVISNPNLELIGSVRQDIGAQLLLNQGYPEKKLHLVNSTKHLIKMLDLDRIPAIALGLDAALWEMKLLGMDTSNYELVFSLQTVETGFGFNKAVDPGLISAMQSALNELRDEGRITFIIEQHRY